MNKTRITFHIPENINTKIIIYDILGKEVKTVLHEDLKPGSHFAELDTSELAPGTYFYRIITDNFTVTKKIIFQKK